MDFSGDSYIPWLFFIASSSLYLLEKFECLSSVQLFQDAASLREIICLL